MNETIIMDREYTSKKRGYSTPELNFMSDILTVKQKVYRLLQKFPYLTEDYNMLVYFYWTYFDNLADLINEDKKIDFVKFHRLTPVETITRCFRKLVEDGKLVAQPTLEKQIARISQEYKFRSYFGRN